MSSDNDNGDNDILMKKADNVHIDDNDDDNDDDDDDDNDDNDE